MLRSLLRLNLSFILIFFAIMPASGEQFDKGMNGKVSMAGEILNSACDIELQNHFQTIKMANDTVSQIWRTGYGNTTTFSMLLTGCPVSAGSDGDQTQHYIRLTFDGPIEKGLIKVLGDVQGVGLEILDSNGIPIQLGKATAPYIVDSNNMRLDYGLRLKTNQTDFKLGDYSSVIRYKIDYF